MFCSKCGSPLVEGAEFCSKCGSAVATTAPVEVYCEKCGYKIGPHNTKCLHCGTPRPDAQVASGAPFVPVPQDRKQENNIGRLAFAALIGLTVFWFVSSRMGSTSPTPSVLDDIIPSSSSKVTYRVTGSASEVSLTIQNASGNTEQIESVRIPWERSFASSGGFAYVSAQNQGDSGTVHCEILVDGRVIEKADSSGGYTIASCSGLAR